MGSPSPPRYIASQVPPPPFLSKYLANFIFVTCHIIVIIATQNFRCTVADLTSKIMLTFSKSFSAPFFNILINLLTTKILHYVLINKNLKLHYLSNKQSTSNSHLSRPIYR
jgi:hypothetical protein